MFVELSHVAHVASLGPGWLWHPLGQCTGTPAEVTRCQSYNFWSGISGSFVTNTPNWIVAGCLLWFHHNCHTEGCWGWARRGKTLCKKCERTDSS